MKLFVGKISFSTTEATLSALFEKYGPLSSCKVITERDTGASRGFAFVEVADSIVGQRAIDELNGQRLDGREIVVNEARPQSDRGTFGRGPRRDFGSSSYSH